MKLIQKLWFRVLVALLGGGILMELVHISTGDPNRPKSFNASLLFGVVLFGILTYIANKRKPMG
jgi:hypothetical protein